MSSGKILDEKPEPIKGILHLLMQGSILLVVWMKNALLQFTNIGTDMKNLIQNALVGVVVQQQINSNEADRKTGPKSPHIIHEVDSILPKNDVLNQLHLVLKNRDGLVDQFATSNFALNIHFS